MTAPSRSAGPRSEIRAVTVAFLLPGSLGLACASGGRPALTPEECAPVEDAVAYDTAALHNLDGRYRLTMVAETGLEAGTTRSGFLTLESYAGRWRRMTGPGGIPMPDVETPYFGSTDIDLEGLGALQLGETGSIDSLQPGVLVIERTAADGDAPASVTLRMGSLINHRQATPFDGGYTALRASRITAESLAGRWSSGAQVEQATGRFCAARVGP